MLRTLSRIVQAVNAAPNLEQSLQVVVREVRAVMNTQSCSIYLMTPNKEGYILMAAEGLKLSSKKNPVRLQLNEGLVGLVGKREELLNIEHANEHPQYRHLPAASDRNYQAFLGAPIIHRRKLLGILVVQQQEPRRFDESEEAILLTMSAQLAGILGHAEATGGFATLPGMVKRRNKQRILTGIASAPGVTIGQAVYAYPLADLDAVPQRKTDNISAEVMIFNTALAHTREEIKRLGLRLKKALPPEEQALFTAYIKILDNSSLGGEVIAQIKTGEWAQGALRTVIKQHVRLFEEMEDEYLRERAADLRDLGRRVLAHLQADKRAIPDYPEKTILVGEEVTASRLIEVPEGNLAGIASARGSSNSHTAILARAMGVPTVMGVEGLPAEGLEGQDLIIDGYYGHVYLNPTLSLKREYKRLEKEERELHDELKTLRDVPAQTQDGYELPLYVNTGLVADIPTSLEAGAQGVGLYRTEVPFMIRDCFPSEEEQRVIYRQILHAFHPLPVNMRSLDVGGDKILPYFPVKEDNPYLGWRGIRIMLDHPELFLVQIRAMLRASVDLNNLHIMLPMVSHLSEVDEALRLIKQAHAEVVDEGTDINLPQIGAMIEVPSAVYQAENLAKKLDFLSVGTNDLTQYILAVDRNNSRVADLYDSLHPAVLSALHYVVTRAHKQHKPVGICGEMASDPMAVIILIAMGFNTLSMNATSLLRVKWVIRNFTLTRAKVLLEEVLAMHCVNDIRAHLSSAIEEAGLGGLIRAGKS